MKDKYKKLTQEGIKKETRFWVTRRHLLTKNTNLQEITLTSLLQKSAKIHLVDSMPIYLPITEPHFFSIITEVQHMLLPKVVFLRVFSHLSPNL